MNIQAQQEELLLNTILQQQPLLMQILEFLSTLDAAAYIAAGVIRNSVWAYLHQLPYDISYTEIDVVFYRKDDSHDSHAAHLLQQLRQRFPNIQWDVTNQATVHEWYRLDNGDEIEPYDSLEHALSVWPETATAIAVRLTEMQEIAYLAPLGLTDLLALKLRWNPALVSHRVFMQRMQQKQFLTQWPQLMWMNEVFDQD